jgi:hypothetical protein
MLLSVGDTTAALRELSEQTGWHCWQGVTGLLYARRPKSSPPKVARAADVDALREAIRAQQAPGS